MIETVLFAVGTGVARLCSGFRAAPRLCLTSDGGLVSPASP